MHRRGKDLSVVRSSVSHRSHGPQLQMEKQHALVMRGEGQGDLGITEHITHTLRQAGQY